MEGKKTIGQVAHGAYCAAMKRPGAYRWQDLPQDVREAWEAAGVAAMNFALEALARVIEKQPIV